MSLIAWIGVITFFCSENFLKKIIFPLVAFSAGALLGGAFLHMLPEAIEGSSDLTAVFLWAILGFSLFFLLEQFIHWHHCHRLPSEHKHPVTYLILVADGVHNFIGGLAIGSAFLVDIKLGVITWLAAAAHELPQEIGDFGILIHGGWKKMKALVVNFISALTIVVGGLVAYLLAGKFSIIYLLAFAAGNFIYIASSDLIPEIKHSDKLKHNLLHFFAFTCGILLLWGIKIIFE